MQDLAPREPALASRPSHLASLPEAEPAGVPSSAASDATSATPAVTPSPSPGFRWDLSLSHLPLLDVAC